MGQSELPAILSRRAVLAAGVAGGAIALLGSAKGGSAKGGAGNTDLIVHNAKVTTLQGGRPAASAFLVAGGRFMTVGTDAEVLRHRTARTLVIDAQGHRVVPGLNDNHLHGVRDGLQYNTELRWDGVKSLQRGLQMIREQSRRIPGDQWVRVMGGWSPYQFEERRFPTVAELNEAAGGAKALVLFAYSKAFLNEAGRAAIGLTRASKPEEGGGYEFIDNGAIVSGTPTIYKVLAHLPSLSRAEQLNSTQYFLRELNRFGLTSFIDAGATGVAYPDDYGAIAELASRPKFPMRISNFLFAQQAGTELSSFQQWTAKDPIGVNMASSRLTGYVLEGGGEILVWDASDYEDFMLPRPEWKPNVARELQAVVEVLTKKHWPIRIHASYDETISQILDVFEPAFKAANYKQRWAIDHAETITPRNIARIKALGGGLAVQDRLAFSGEFFAARYGEQAAASAQPLRAMLDMGVPLSAGTDATRVSSYNPWVSLYWMVTRKTLGGTQFGGHENILSRKEALRLYTMGSAWLSGEDAVKGRIAPGQYADFAVLSADYMTIPPEQILSIESVLTVTGGDIVYSAGRFAGYEAGSLPAVTPAWSPVARFGGYQV
jgi:predicted amidohydrolase YtcJ